MSDHDQAVEAAIALLRAEFEANSGPPPEQPRYNASEARLLAKFEQFPSDITVLARQAPGNPHHLLVGKRFPRMLYKAQRSPKTGKFYTGADMPRRDPGEPENEWQARCQETERFAASCQLIVQDEVEYSRAHEQGWRDSAQEAMEFVVSRQHDAGQEAAERNFRDRNMSEKALAESEKAEKEHFGHLPEIPEQPIPRTKRKYTRRTGSEPAA